MSPTLQSWGQNQNWRTSRRICYITSTIWGVSNAFQQGGKSEVAHKRADRLCHHCHLGGLQGFRAGDKVTGGPHVGRLATSALHFGGSPNTLERGTKSEVAHIRADWLHHPCHFGAPQRFRAGDKIRIGLQVGELATSLVPSQGVPNTLVCVWGRISSGTHVGALATSPLASKVSSTLDNRGQNQK